MPENGPTAQAHVLATIELLELIFLRLDPEACFAIQRVCRRWESLINDSHRLQEHMFLRSPPDTNTLPSTLCYQQMDADCNSPRFNTEHLEDVSLCPVLEIADHFVRTHPGQLTVSCSQGALWGHPSWHKMLLSIPSCKSATVAMWWRIGEAMRGSIYLESITNPSGLRFTDVVEAALAQRAGKWKEMPDGKTLPLSAAGLVTLGEFLQQKAGDDVRIIESTSVFVLSF